MRDIDKAIKLLKPLAERYCWNDKWAGSQMEKALVLLKSAKQEAMKKRKAKTIEDVCLEFKEKMQRLVDRKGSGVSKMSLTVGDGKEMVIAERRPKKK